MLNAIRQGFRQRDQRIKVLLPARLRSGSSWSDACIHNVSSRGMLVASNDAPGPGTYIELKRGANVVVGRVVWRKDQFFGVKAQDRINLDALREAGARKQNPSNDATVDRRSVQRLSDDVRGARALERSRAIGKASQFATIAMVCLFASLLAGHAVHKMLNQPITKIAAVMPK